MNRRITDLAASVAFVAFVAAALIFTMANLWPSGATVPREGHHTRHLPVVTYPAPPSCVRGDLPVGGKWRGWTCS